MKTKTICFLNRKGGVGSTLFASHTVYYAQALGFSTLGISLDQNNDMAQFLTPTLPWADATEAIPPGPWDLRVVDVWAHSNVAHALRPDLCAGVELMRPNIVSDGRRSSCPKEARMARYAPHGPNGDHRARGVATQDLRDPGSPA